MLVTHVIPQVQIEAFPELLSGNRGACMYLIVNTEAELYTPEIVGLEKHIGSLAFIRDEVKITVWQGTLWVKPKF